MVITETSIQLRVELTICFLLLHHFHHRILLLKCDCHMFEIKKGHLCILQSHIISLEDGN